MERSNTGQPGGAAKRQRLEPPEEECEEVENPPKYWRQKRSYPQSFEAQCSTKQGPHDYFKTMVVKLECILQKDNLETGEWDVLGTSECEMSAFTVPVLLPDDPEGVGAPGGAAASQSPGAGTEPGLEESMEGVEEFAERSLGQLFAGAQAAPGASGVSKDSFSPVD